MSNMFLNEDWLDNINPEDIDSDDKRNIESEIESTDGSRGSHCLHFYPREGQFMTLPLNKRQKYTLQHIIDNALALEHVQVGQMVPENGRDSDENKKFLSLTSASDYEDYLDMLHSPGINLRTPDLQIWFDFDERQSDNIKYMCTVIWQAYYILFRTYYDIENIPVETYPSFTMSTSDNERIPLLHQSFIPHYLYRQLRYGICPSELDMRNVSQVITYLTGKEVTEKECKTALAEKLTWPKKTADLLRVHSVPASFFKAVKYERKKKTDPIKITILSGKTVTFRNIHLDVIATEENSQLNLFVDGTLIVNGLEEYSNLRFLNKEYEHNEIVFNGLVTPSILRYILCNTSFRTIDLQNAEVPNDDTIDIDMSFPKIRNKNVQIITNEHINVL